MRKFIWALNHRIIPWFIPRGDGINGSFMPTSTVRICHFHSPVLLKRFGVWLWRMHISHYFIHWIYFPFMFFLDTTFVVFLCNLCFSHVSYKWNILGLLTSVIKDREKIKTNITVDEYYKNRPLHQSDQQNTAVFQNGLPLCCVQLSIWLSS